MKSVLLFASLAVLAVGCKQSPKAKPEKIDTVIVSYKDQQVGWRLNTAIRRQYMGHKFLSDSVLDAKWDYISVFRLQVPAQKEDSILDSVSHKLLRIKPRYQGQWLPDTLSHYLTVLDSTK